MLEKKLFGIVCLLLFFSGAQCNDSFEKYLRELQLKISTVNVSTPCSDFYNSINILDRNDLIFLVSLIDSSAKIPTGLLAGNMFELGNFDECFSLSRTSNNITVDGKYCVGTIPFSNPSTLKTIHQITPRMIGNDMNSIGIHFSFCTPSVCSTEDLQTIVGSLEPFGWIFQDDLCYSKSTEPELSTGAIATIAVLSVFAAIVLISTIYDVVLYYTEKEPLHGILLAFSAISNGKKIITSTNSPEQLLCLNGIKAISMAWVIIGHKYSLTSMSPVSNYFELGSYLNQTENMWIIAAPVSVDSFFTVGGLVTMFTFLKACDKGVSFNIPMYYIHRYLRLTPALAIATLVYANLLSYLGNGPLWGTVDTLMQPCKDNWWAGLLYIQNYYNYETVCVPQTWYLSVDMQLFILSPLVLFPTKRWPKSTNIILAVLIALGIIVPFTVSFYHNLQGLMGTSPDTLKYMHLYYFQTYARFGPYVIGMLFGSIIYRLRKNKYKPKKDMLHVMGSLGIWVAVMTGMVACLYGGANMLTDEYNVWSSSMYNALHRNAWSLGLCIIILLCVTGYGGPVDAILSISVFQFITKLSYAMYLVHYCILHMRNASSRTLVQFSNFSIMLTFWGDFMLTLLLSFVLCIMFESPVIILEKYLLGGAPKKIEKPQKMEEP